jgi:ABC-type Mn2+/Zn2+ transport system permease subunit
VLGPCVCGHEIEFYWSQKTFHSSHCILQVVVVIVVVVVVVVVVIIREAYYLSTDNTYVKFVGYNIRVSHYRHVYNC